MVEVLLELEIFLTKDSQVEDLLCGAPSCSEASLFFSDDRLRLWLKFLQHDLAWVADKADCLVALTLLQVAFLGKCDDQGRSTGLAILLSASCESGDYFLSTCLDQVCSKVVNSS